VTLNLTVGHFASFVVLVALAAQFFKGWQLIRVIAWLGLWQLLTPSRGFWEDSLMLGCGFWISECAYRFARKFK